MKHTIHILTVVLMSMAFVSCSNGQNGQNKSATEQVRKDIPVTEFEKKMDGAQLLDVRTPEEWSTGVIEGALMHNIHADDFENQLEKLDKEKPVTVYCKSGGRSGQAADMMKEKGFKEVYNLKGGITAWKAADKPTVNPE